MISLRKIFPIPVATLFLAFVFGCFSACNTAEEEHIYNPYVPPAEEERIFAPYIISFGEFLYWEPCENASSYDIYKENELIASTTDCEYEILTNDNDTEYYVVAKNEDSSIQSKKSNIVSVSKTEGFTATEILDYSDALPSGEIYIGPDIRAVVLRANEVTHINAHFVLEKRTQDIRFIMENINLLADDNFAAIQLVDKSVSRMENNWNLVLDISGECSVTGGAQTNMPDIPAVNSGEDGFTGFEGMCGIRVPTLVVYGNGCLNIIGGVGGNGGTGAFSSGVSSAVYGKGGKGGTGGDGVLCQYFIMQMENEGRTQVSGGKGGTGGYPGDNGSVVTGPWVTGQWSSAFGSDGSSGRSIYGSILGKSGTLIY